MINNNLHLIPFPLSLNKLLIHKKEDKNQFTILNTLKNAGTLVLKNLTNVSNDDL